MGPPKYEAGVLATQIQCLIMISIISALTSWSINVNFIYQNTNSLFTPGCTLKYIYVLEERYTTNDSP